MVLVCLTSYRTFVNASHSWFVAMDGWYVTDPFVQIEACIRPMLRLCLCYVSLMMWLKFSMPPCITPISDSVSHNYMYLLCDLVCLLLNTVWIMNKTVVLSFTGQRSCLKVNNKMLNRDLKLDAENSSTCEPIDPQLGLTNTSCRVWYYRSL